MSLIKSFRYWNSNVHYEHCVQFRIIPYHYWDLVGIYVYYALHRHLSQSQQNNKSEVSHRQYHFFCTYCRRLR